MKFFLSAAGQINEQNEDRSKNMKVDMFNGIRLINLPEVDYKAQLEKCNFKFSATLHVYFLLQM